MALRHGIAGMTRAAHVTVAFHAHCGSARCALPPRARAARPVALILITPAQLGSGAGAAHVHCVQSKRLGLVGDPPADSGAVGLVRRIFGPRLGLLSDASSALHICISFNLGKS